MVSTLKSAFTAAVSSTIMKFLYLSLLYGFVSSTEPEQKKEIPPEKLETCLDHKGKVVSHGERFFPLGSDPCTQCTCLNGKPEMCISVFCSPPENCRQFHALSDKCCEFVCLDRDFPNKGSGNGTYSDSDSLSTTNLGLRLVASTVTSFLILALLLFMIHRLRQRRLLLMIRRFHARRMDTGNSHLSRRFSEDDDGSVGYFVGHDQLDFSRYDEPPPPYTLWKPPEMYIPPGEAPPPYDLSVQLTAPFTSNGRCNFLSSNRTEAPAQMQRAAPVSHAEPTVTVAQVTVEHIPVDTQNVNEVEVGDQIPSVSSANVLTDGEGETSNSGGRVVLPPDLQYEESHSYRSTNTSTVAANTVSLQEDTAIRPDVSDDDVVNDNTVTNVASSSSNTAGFVNSCTCNTHIRKGRTWSKRHSCGEFSAQSRHKSSARANPERLSLDPMTSRLSNNNLYPDPTIWNGEISESSSSSSPTYGLPTPSPSTSDSSFADAEFTRRHHIENDSKHLSGTSTLRSISSVSSRDANGCIMKSEDDDLNRAPPLQKTLSNLKRFSLIKRKKKKRKEDRPNEICCSVVCQNVSDSILTAQPVVQTVTSESSVGRCQDVSGTRPIEAINPHIGHKLASSGIRGVSRPNNISITSNSEENALNGSTNNIYSNSSHSRNNVRITHAAVAGVHQNTSSVGSQKNLDVYKDIDTFSGEPISYSNQSPTIAQKGGISRSGSICSETGERRYHKSTPPGLSPPCNSRVKYANEVPPHVIPGPSSESCYSSGCVSLDDDLSIYTNHRTYKQDSTVKNIPLWIVNSVGISARQDYESTARSTPSTLGRCASTSQIAGNINNCILDSSLARALEIRDPSMCDSSWEACSHL